MHLVHQVLALEGFDLAKSDCSMFNACKSEAEFNTTISSAKAEYSVCVFGIIHMISLSPSFDA